MVAITAGTPRIKPAIAHQRETPHAITAVNRVTSAENAPAPRTKGPVTAATRPVTSQEIALRLQELASLVASMVPAVPVRAPIKSATNAERWATSRGTAPKVEDMEGDHSQREDSEVGTAVVEVVLDKAPLVMLAVDSGIWRGTARRARSAITAA